MFLRRIFDIIIKHSTSALEAELEQPYVQWRTTIFLTFLFSSVSYVLNELFNLPPVDIIFVFHNPVVSIIWLCSFSLLGIAVSHLTARFLGSQGEMKKYAYLITVLGGIIAILYPLVLVIPVVGDIISIVITIYSMYLAYFAVARVYELSIVKNLLIAFVPLILYIGLLFCYMMLNETMTIPI